MPLVIFGALGAGIIATAFVKTSGDSIEQAGNASLKFGVFAIASATAYFLIKRKVK